MSEQINNEQQKSMEKRKKKAWSTPIILGSLSLAIVASATSSFYLLNSDKKEVLTANSDIKQIPQVAERKPQATKPKNLERPEQFNNQETLTPKYASPPLLRSNDQTAALKNKIRSEISKYLTQSQTNTQPNSIKITDKAKNKTNPRKKTTSNDQTKKAISDPENERTYESKKLKDKEKQEAKKQSTNTIVGSRVIKPSENNNSTSKKQQKAQLTTKTTQQPTKPAIENSTQTMPTPKVPHDINQKAIGTSLAAEHVVKKSELSNKKTIVTDDDKSQGSSSSSIETIVTTATPVASKKSTAVNAHIESAEEIKIDTPAKENKPADTSPANVQISAETAKPTAENVSKEGSDSTKPQLKTATVVTATEPKIKKATPINVTTSETAVLINTPKTPKVETDEHVDASETPKVETAVLVDAPETPKVETDVLVDASETPKAKQVSTTETEHKENMETPKPDQDNLENSAGAAKPIEKPAEQVSEPKPQAAVLVVTPKTPESETAVPVDAPETPKVETDVLVDAPETPKVETAVLVDAPETPKPQTAELVVTPETPKAEQVSTTETEHKENMETPKLDQDNLEDSAGTAKPTEKPAEQVSEPKPQAAVLVVTPKTPESETAVPVDAPEIPKVETAVPVDAPETPKVETDVLVDASETPKAKQVSTTETEHKENMETPKPAHVNSEPAVETAKPTEKPAEQVSEPKPQAAVLVVTPETPKVETAVLVDAPETPKVEILVTDPDETENTPTNLEQAESAAAQTIRILQDIIDSTNLQISEIQKNIEDTLKTLQEKSVEDIPPKPLPRTGNVEIKFDWEDSSCFEWRTYATTISNYLQTNSKNNQQLIQSLNEIKRTLDGALSEYNTNAIYLESLNKLLPPELPPRPISIISSPVKLTLHSSSKPLQSDYEFIVTPPSTPLKASAKPSPSAIPPFGKPVLPGSPASRLNFDSKEDTNPYPISIGQELTNLFKNGLQLNHCAPQTKTATSPLTPYEQMLYDIRRGPKFKKTNAKQQMYVEIYNILSEDMFFQLDPGNNPDDMKFYQRWISLNIENAQDPINIFYSNIKKIYCKLTAAINKQFLNELALDHKIVDFYSNNFECKVTELKAKNIPGSKFPTSNASSDVDLMSALVSYKFRINEQPDDDSDNSEWDTPTGTPLQSPLKRSTRRKSTPQKPIQLNSRPDEREMKTRLSIWKLQLNNIGSIGEYKHYTLDTKVDSHPINGENQCTYTLYGVIKNPQQQIVGLVLQNDKVILPKNTDPTNNISDVPITPENISKISISTTEEQTCNILFTNGDELECNYFDITNIEFQSNIFSDFAKNAYPYIFNSAIIDPILSSKETSLENALIQILCAIKFIDMFDSNLAESFKQTLQLKSNIHNIDALLNATPKHESNVPNIFSYIIPQLKDKLKKHETDDLRKSNAIRIKLQQQLPDEILGSNDLMKMLIKLTEFTQFNQSIPTPSEEQIAQSVQQISTKLQEMYQKQCFAKYFPDFKLNSGKNKDFQLSRLPFTYPNAYPKYQQDISEFSKTVNKTIEDYVKTCYMYELALKDNPDFKLAVWGKMRDAIGAKEKQPDMEQSFAEQQIQLLINHFNTPEVTQTATDTAQTSADTTQTATAPTAITATQQSTKPGTLSRLRKKAAALIKGAAAPKQPEPIKPAEPNLDLKSLTDIVKQLTDARDQAKTAEMEKLRTEIQKQLEIESFGTIADETLAICLNAITPDALSTLSIDDMKFYVEHTYSVNLDSLIGLVQAYYAQYLNNISYDKSQGIGIINEFRQALGLPPLQEVPVEETPEKIISKIQLDPDFIDTSDEQADGHDVHLTAADDSIKEGILLPTDKAHLTDADDSEEKGTLKPTDEEQPNDDVDSDEEGVLLSADEGYLSDADDSEEKGTLKPAGEEHPNDDVDGDEDKLQPANEVPLEKPTTLQLDLYFIDPSDEQTDGHDGHLTTAEKGDDDGVLQDLSDNDDKEEGQLKFPPDDDDGDDSDDEEEGTLQPLDEENPTDTEEDGDVDDEEEGTLQPLDGEYTNDDDEEDLQNMSNNDKGKQKTQAVDVEVLTSVDYYGDEKSTLLPTNEVPDKKTTELQLDPDFADYDDSDDGEGIYGTDSEKESSTPNLDSTFTSPDSKKKHFSQFKSHNT